MDVLGVLKDDRRGLLRGAESLFAGRAEGGLVGFHATEATQETYLTTSECPPPRRSAESVGRARGTSPDPAISGRDGTAATQAGCSSQTNDCVAGSPSRSGLSDRAGITVRAADSAAATAVRIVAFCRIRARSLSELSDWICPDLMDTSKGWDDPARERLRDANMAFRRWSWA